MKFATESRGKQVLVWLVWVIVGVVSACGPGQTTALVGIVIHPGRDGPIFPWQPKRRLRALAWRRYCAWRRAYVALCGWRVWPGWLGQGH